MLLIDQAALRQMIAAAPADQAIEVFVHNIDRAALFPGGEDDLIKICMETSGSGKRTIERALKAERVKRKNKKSKLRAAKRSAMDSRPAIPAPAGDAELDAFATTVETLLAISTQPVPAFRGLNGKLAVLVEQPVSGLHLLESATVNQMDAGAEAGRKTQWKAPPPETRVVELTHWTSVAMELERHLRLIRTRADGDVAFVRADATIYEAINNRLGRSGLKTIKAAQTLPIVLPKATGRSNWSWMRGSMRGSGFTCAFHRRFARERSTRRKSRSPTERGRTSFSPTSGWSMSRATMTPRRC